MSQAECDPSSGALTEERTDLDADGTYDEESRPIEMLHLRDRPERLLETIEWDCP